MSTVLKRTLLSSLIVPFALGAQSVSAELITNWGYNVDSSFDNFTQTAGEGEVTQTDEGGVDTLQWGIGPGPQSSVSIEDVSAESGLITNGGFEDGGSFTHTNNVLPIEGAALASFDLSSQLTLTPFAPTPGSDVELSPITFMSFFIETANSAGNCIPESESVCDDIFTIDNIDALGGEVVDGNYRITSPSFTLDDYTYTVILELVGLGPLSSAACAEAGAGDGCVGFITQEDNVNSFDTRFAIVTEQVPVPEPGTLALLGLGLAGLGLSRRKKQ